MNKKNTTIPTFDNLINPVFTALQDLGKSGSNIEILNKVIENLKLSDEIIDTPHYLKDNSKNGTELGYRLAWAKTYLKKYGAITNSSRSIWSITPDFVTKDKLDKKEVVKYVISLRETNKSKDKNKPEDNDSSNDNIEFPEEQQPWKIKLLSVIQKMEPIAFERLTQRFLRESGFEEVEVTQPTRDGGIDGKGMFKINGIISFKIAFQCKRYNEDSHISASDIRDFRGSLTTDIEKGLFITTGTFSKSARDEASKLGKKLIDLIDGNALIDKLAELEIGVKKLSSYEIDEEFFKKI